MSKYRINLYFICVYLVCCENLCDTSFISLIQFTMYIFTFPSRNNLNQQCFHSQPTRSTIILTNKVYYSELILCNLTLNKCLSFCQAHLSLLQTFAFFSHHPHHFFPSFSFSHQYVFLPLTLNLGLLLLVRNVLIPQTTLLFLNR